MDKAIAANRINMEKRINNLRTIYSKYYWIIYRTSGGCVCGCGGGGGGGGCVGGGGVITRVIVLASSYLFLTEGMYTSVT